MRGATYLARFTSSFLIFQSTLLMRGATSSARLSRYCPHISIHAPHARSDPFPAVLVPSPEISIHAPHARSDSTTDSRFTSRIISIHAPHARSDRVNPYGLEWWGFQSTLLMRGATTQLIDKWEGFKFQSTLLMRGATLHSSYVNTFLNISIHAPHARSDLHRRMIIST